MTKPKTRKKIPKKKNPAPPLEPLDAYRLMIASGKTTAHDIRDRLRDAIRAQQEWLRIKTPYAKKQAGLLENHIKLYRKLILFADRTEARPLIAAVH